MSFGIWEYVLFKLTKNLRKGLQWCWPLAKYILMRLRELALQAAAGWRQPSKPSSTLGATTATTAGTSSNYRHPLNQQPKDGEIAPKSICPTTENKNWSTHEVTTTGRSSFYRHLLKKGSIKVRPDDPKSMWPATDKLNLICPSESYLSFFL